MNSILIKIGKAVGLAGAILTVADFAQPIAPIASFVLVGSIVFLIVLLVLRFIVHKWNESLSILSYFSALCLVMSLFLFSSYNENPDIEKKGLLGASFPGINKLHQSMGLVTKELKNISGSVSSMDRKMDNLKKETSDDPRKELSNMGLSWSASQFYNAASRADKKIMNLFIKGGMKADATLPYLNIPVIVNLVEKNQGPILDTLEYFIENGYDINKKLSIVRIRTAAAPKKLLQLDLLETAVEKGNLKVLKYLLSKSPNTNNVKQFLNDELGVVAKEFAHYCYKFDGPIEKELVRSEYTDILVSGCIKKLLVNIRDKSLEKKKNMLNSAYQAVFNKEYQLAVDKDNDRGLEGALILGDLKLVNYYLSHGANVNRKLGNTDKSSLLCLSSLRRNSLEITKRLIKLGASINYQSTSGLSPLHCFIYSNRIDLVKNILSLKPNLEYYASGKFFKGNRTRKLTPLQLAFFKKNLEIFNLLLKAGAKYQNLQGRYGKNFVKTVLKNDPAYIKALISSGFNPYQRYNGKDSAIEWAQKRKKLEILANLEKKECKTLDQAYRSINRLYEAEAGPLVSVELKINYTKRRLDELSVYNVDNNPQDKAYYIKKSGILREKISKYKETQLRLKKKYQSIVTKVESAKKKLNVCIGMAQ